ncbi:MAG: hypothetical protein EOP06_07235 [Proteobacteria bacterium]|nr:MAG: hypothetical protein EOP06_07235 [Pseudomonadota bacterium]
MMKSKSGASPASDAAMISINELYLKDIKPIFKRSCFDCHSSSTTYPWYSKMPGAKQLIRNDINEAKQHLDLTNDFPFAGHGSPPEDLVAINEQVQDGDMPPWRYRVLHSDSKLTDDEKAAVQAWVEKSLSILKVASPGTAHHRNEK